MSFCACSGPNCCACQVAGRRCSWAVMAGTMRSASCRHGSGHPVGRVHGMPAQHACAQSRTDRMLGRAGVRGRGGLGLRARAHAGHHARQAQWCAPCPGTAAGRLPGAGWSSLHRLQPRAACAQPWACRGGGRGRAGCICA
jgi:hypothetical protein